MQRNKTKQNKKKTTKNEGLDVYVDWQITFNRLIFIFLAKN